MIFGSGGNDERFEGKCHVHRATPVLERNERRWGRSPCVQG
jgi:hypothetical protein